MTPDQARFKRASIEALRAEYLFALGHLCGIDPTQPMKLRDLFRLVLDVDKYIAEQKAANQ